MHQLIDRYRIFTILYQGVPGRKLSMLSKVVVSKELIGLFLLLLIFAIPMMRVLLVKSLIERLVAGG